jgi:hypothetical protein
MALRSDPVEAALERWERAGLLAPELGRALRAEASEHARRSGRRLVQYALAGTGALILLIAAGVFADWLWPYLGDAARAVALGLVGVAVHGLGLNLRRGERWRAASYLLQIAGMLILLGTFAYSENAWPSATVGGMVVGLLALVTPVVVAPRSLLRRDPVMPAAHLALSLAFLATFLWRGLGLSGITIVWVLDGVLAVLGVLLIVELRRARGAAEAEWALNAFVTALYAGFVLVTLTSVGPLGLETRVVYPMNVWLAGIVALTLWGMHRAPPALQRSWYERQLGFAVLASIPLLFATSQAVWRAPAEVTSLLIAGVGALALRYAIGNGARSTLFAACFALLVAAWHFGLDRGGALGVVLSLAASAALLFWISTRVGWRQEGEGAGGDGGGSAPSVDAPHPAP